MITTGIYSGRSLRLEDEDDREFEAAPDDTTFPEGEDDVGENDVHEDRLKSGDNRLIDTESL